MIAYFLYFLLWTLILYWVHRISHKTLIIKNIHWDHHKFVNLHKVGWHWNNLFLFNDTWASTLDLWITEVIPTIIFSIITHQWWICILYYVWAALMQENLEHNEDIDFPFLTCGKWHRIHHRTHNKNYSLFFPHWDILFGTYKKVVNE